MRDDAFSTRAQTARATAGFTAQADALAKRCKSGVLKLFTQLAKSDEVEREALRHYCRHWDSKPVRLTSSAKLRRFC